MHSIDDEILVKIKKAGRGSLFKIIWNKYYKAL